MIIRSAASRQRRADARKRQDAYWARRNGPVVRIPAQAQAPPPDAGENTSGDGPTSGTALSLAREDAAGYR